MTSKGKIQLKKCRISMVPSVVNWGGNVRMYFRAINGDHSGIMEVVLNDQLVPASFRRCFCRWLPLETICRRLTQHKLDL